MFRVTESFALHLPTLEEANVARVTEALMPGGGSYALEVKLAAIHEGLTRNYTYYSKEGLTHTNKDDQGHPGGLESWLKPTPAPVIKNHDGSSVDNIIGRMSAAEWVEKSGKTPGHLQLTAEITEPEAIAKFLRGEYQTGSVGLDVDNALCSICNEDLQASGWGGMFHEHQRGKFYKKGEKGSENEGRFVEAAKTDPGAKLAKVMVGNCYGREYSMVVTPSDAKSRVTSMEVKEVKLKGKKSETDQSESFTVLKPHFTEHVADPVDPVTDPVDPVKTRSIAELAQAHRSSIEADPLSFYAWMLNQKAEALFKGRGAEESVITLDGMDLRLTEVDGLISHILNTNEDLEDELKEIAYCVLSTETTQLPDSSFALIANDGNKKLRGLPYKNVEGQIDPVALRVSLSRWNTPSDVFEVSETARAQRKLNAALIKLLNPTTESEEVRLEAAKALLTSKGFQVLTSSDSSAQEAELKAKIEELKTEVGTLTREALDRDTELDTLTEQVQDLGTELETAQATLKGTIVEAILTIQGFDEETRSAKITEMLTLEPKALETQLTEVITEQAQLFASAKVGRKGLGVENEVTETPAELADQGGAVLAALLGSKGARREISSLIKKLPK
jgi:hypothetical protein